MNRSACEKVVYAWLCMHGCVCMVVYAWLCMHGCVCMVVYFLSLCTHVHTNIDGHT